MCLPDDLLGNAAFVQRLRSFGRDPAKRVRVERILEYVTCLQGLAVRTMEQGSDFGRGRKCEVGRQEVGQPLWHLEALLRSADRRRKQLAPGQLAESSLCLGQHPDGTGDAGGSAC